MAYDASHILRFEADYKLTVREGDLVVMRRGRAPGEYVIPAGTSKRLAVAKLLGLLDAMALPKVATYDHRYRRLCVDDAEVVAFFRSGHGMPLYVRVNVSRTGERTYTILDSHHAYAGALHYADIAEMHETAATAMPVHFAAIRRIMAETRKLLEYTPNKRKRVDMYEALWEEGGPKRPRQA